MALVETLEGHPRTLVSQAGSHMLREILLVEVPWCSNPGSLLRGRFMVVRHSSRWTLSSQCERNVPLPAEAALHKLTTRLGDRHQKPCTEQFLLCNKPECRRCDPQHAAREARDLEKNMKMQLQRAELFRAHRLISGVGHCTCCTQPQVREPPCLCGSHSMCDSTLRAPFTH